MVYSIYNVHILGLVLDVAVTHKDVLCSNSLCIFYKAAFKL